MGDYRDTVARFYDGTAKPTLINRLLFEGSEFSNYGYWRPGTGSVQEACENLMEELLGHVPDKAGRILDVACGKGATTAHLCKYYDPANVVGTNISKEQLAKCRQNAPGCTFLEMDATDLAFPDSSFDCVICVEAAFHFDTRETFLREAHRVLKPGGHLLLADQLLPPGAMHQPPANLVANADEYGAVLRRAKFQPIEIVDATDRCIGGRFEHIGRVLRERFSGLAAQPQLAGRLARLVDERWKDHVYLLVACAKPARARPKAGARVRRIKSAMIP